MPPDPPTNARTNGARAQAARSAMGLQIFEILATPLPAPHLDPSSSSREILSSLFTFCLVSTDAALTILLDSVRADHVFPLEFFEPRKRIAKAGA